MKRILIILLLALAAFPAFAQMGSPIIIPIWPDGAPNDNGIVTEEGHPSPRSVDNVSKPELWVFPAFRPNGTVIIACPGGGYYYLEIEKEGTGFTPQSSVCFRMILTASWTSLSVVSKWPFGILYFKTARVTPM